MLRRLPWLLALLAVSALGCGGDEIIGNAFYDAGLALDGAVPASDAGGQAAEDAALAADAGDAQVNTRSATLIQASQALAGVHWLSREFAFTPPASMRLAFEPAAGSAQGTFVLYCPNGCLFSDILRDPALTANRSSQPSVSAGSYALYHLTNAGKVLGSLFDEQGTAIDLQFEWRTGPSGAPPLEEIFLLSAPIGRLGFLPDRSGHN